VSPPTGRHVARSIHRQVKRHRIGFGTIVEAAAAIGVAGLVSRVCPGPCSVSAGIDNRRCHRRDATTWLYSPYNACRELVTQVAVVVTAYVLMSALAFSLFWVDKRRAARGQWRVPERTLHVLEMLGGWPGAWVGQRVFRHKWRKTRYMVVFWAIAGAHLLAWAWWAGAFASLIRSN
jgi:uncharacterized membrane protein YsdA (DUF1294 family)